jgi:flagellar basal body rod protein FlgB
MREFVSMLSTTPTTELLARALDVSALRQSVHTANVANATVDGFRRLEVRFDRELERLALSSLLGGSGLGAAKPTATVVPTDLPVKLDEEVGLMARNALRHQTLLTALQKSSAVLRMAVREGRE